MPGETVHAGEGLKAKIGGGVSLLWDGSKYVQPTGQSDGSSNVTDTSQGTGTEYEGISKPSPLTSVGTTPVILQIPVNAKNLYVIAAAAIRYGDNAVLDGTAGEGYMYLPAYSESQPIPVADRASLYFRINASSGTTTVYFRFDDRD